MKIIHLLSHFIKKKYPVIKRALHTIFINLVIHGQNIYRLIYKAGCLVILNIKKSSLYSAKTLSNTGFKFYQFIYKTSRIVLLKIKAFTLYAGKVLVKAMYKLYRITNKTIYLIITNIRVFTWYLVKVLINAGHKSSSLIKRAIHFINIKWPPVSNKIDQYIILTRLNKPIGIFLLLWPTLWALWIAAEGLPDQWILLTFIIGVLLMRSAGCTLNDVADRKIDKHIARTRERPLTTGKIKVKEALILALLLIMISFGFVLTLNLMTILLSIIALFLAVIYPFTKRYTYLPQFFLGLAFAWSVPMAFSAQTGILTPVTWLLLIATVLWAMAYDTMYAMVDREDDLKVGVKSTAILFDDADKLIIGIIQFLIILTLVFIGLRQGMSPVYYGAILAGSLFLIYQQFLIRDREPEHCFAAFLNNNWFGATIFIGIFLNYWYQAG